MDLIIARIEAFFLIFVRIFTLLALMPVFNSKLIPVMVRVSIGLVLAVLLFPIVDAASIAGAGTGMFVVVVLREILIGVVVGFVAEFLFHAVRFGGDILNNQLGFAMASMIDPLSSERSSLIAQYKWMTAMMIFLALDGHLFLIQAMAASFTLIPLGKADVSGPFFEHVVRLSADIFVIAIKLAAPVLVALLLTNVAMGILARVLPQMNIFIIGFPLTIGIGLIAIVMVLPLFTHAFSQYFETAKRELMHLLQVMGR